MTIAEKALADALREMIRWVGKAQADHAYDQCVSAPHGAERAMAKAKEALALLEEAA